MKATTIPAWDDKGVDEDEDIADDAVFVILPSVVVLLVELPTRHLQ